MNTSLAITRGTGMPILGEGVALLGLPSEKSAKRELSGSAAEIVKTIAAILDRMLIGIIEKRTAQDFEAAFDQAFPAYMRLILCLSGIVSAIEPNSIVSRLAIESLDEIEADIEDQAPAAFGADIHDQAIFAIWTLRKITDLLQAISSAGTAPECDKDEDKEFFSHFLFHVLRARFSLECLTTSMRSKRTIYPDVLVVIAERLRSAVDAYVWIRQAADLWSPNTEVSSPPIQLDAEDRQLLNESMSDMAHEPF